MTKNVTNMMDDACKQIKEVEPAISIHAESANSPVDQYLGGGRPGSLDAVAEVETGDELNEAVVPHKIGTRVKTDLGQIGTITKVKKNDPGYPHYYKVRDDHGSNLENGQYLTHDTLTPIKESVGEVFEESETPPIKVRSDYAHAYATLYNKALKQNPTRQASTKAKHSAYVHIENKHGRDMCEKLMKFHDANRLSEGADHDDAWLASQTKKDKRAKKIAKKMAKRNKPMTEASLPSYAKEILGKAKSEQQKKNKVEKSKAVASAPDHDIDLGKADPISGARRKAEIERTSKTKAAARVHSGSYGKGEDTFKGDYENSGVEVIPKRVSDAPSWLEPKAITPKSGARHVAGVNAKHPEEELSDTRLAAMKLRLSRMHPVKHAEQIASLQKQIDRHQNESVESNDNLVEGAVIINVKTGRPVHTFKSEGEAEKHYSEVLGNSPEYRVVSTAPARVSESAMDTETFANKQMNIAAKDEAAPKQLVVKRNGVALRGHPTMAAAQAHLDRIPANIAKEHSIVKEDTDYELSTVKEGMMHRYSIIRKDEVVAEGTMISLESACSMIEKKLDAILEEKTGKTEKNVEVKDVLEYVKSYAKSVSESVIDYVPEGFLKKKDLNKIAKYTDENWHGKAIQHGSKIIGRDDLEDKMKQINKEHLKAGGLSHDIMNRRNAVSKEMFDHAKAKLHPNDYEKFHNSF
jgi:hypothetical protein